MFKSLRKTLGLPALIYGMLTTVLYLIIYLTGVSRSGIWMILYFFSLPISWLTNLVICIGVDYLPSGLGSFAYETQVILAGMIWWWIAFILFKKLKSGGTIRSVGNQ